VVAAIGRWSSRHPWLAIAVWVGFVAFALAGAAGSGTRSLWNGSVGESARGYDLMNAHGVWPPSVEYGYVHSAALRANEPAFRSAVADVEARMQAGFGGETEVRVSADRHSAIVVATPATVPSSIRSVRASVLEAAPAHPQVMIGEAGAFSASDARNRAGNQDLRRAELLAVPVTFFVLLFAFGSLVAALVPVVLALSAVAAAFGLLGPISQVFPLDSSVKVVVLLIGMAVGVDYALFYVVRSREERSRGLTSHEALERTARTSGRTVLVSGTTVIVALAGLFVIDSNVFNAIASGTIAVVACAVAGSVTVLPAILELLGPRLDRARVPFLPHLRTDGSGSRFWPAVVDRVLRRPVLSIVLATGLLLAIAAPALSLHVSKPSGETLSSQSNPVFATLDQVRKVFPSTAAPAMLVVVGPASAQPAARRAIDRLERLAVARGITHPPFTLTASTDGAAASVELPLTGAGDNTASRQAILLLRRELVPETLGRLPGLETAVTGVSAEDVDFTQQVKDGLPYVIAFVLTFAFVLLLLAFRSLVVPIKAIVLNLLSVGAAYGVLVLVFQHGWVQGLLGFQSNGTIISWLPLFLFVILFGLSMDYHVFILSRVREGVDQGMTNDAAVKHGISVTAGVVTSAALVMVGVFSLFATISSLELKQAGVGLAAAVLIDATIVRAVLLPASMKLLGNWNWYLPHWLRWLPQTTPPRPGMDVIGLCPDR
jgi:RND superfamily putative drug exporter